MILSTSEKNGFCYVETAELDGETNLKCRQSLAETATLGDNIDALSAFDGKFKLIKIDQLSMISLSYCSIQLTIPENLLQSHFTNKGEIICETPNNNLTKFEGTLFWEDKQFAIDNDKMLLRGCILRNTKWCFGLVVFAGKETKLMQNSGKTIFKRTKSDRLLNILIMGIVLALITMCLFACIACGVWEMMTGRYSSRYIPRSPSIQDDNFTGTTLKSIMAFLSYLILLNTVVPISLYVSVEVIRQCQSLLIDFDKRMYYAPKDSYAKARTTTLNEELGQVEYIFSDKTGTLTQNKMTFNKCSINGILYGEVKDFATGEMIDVNTDNERLFTPIDFSKLNDGAYFEPEFKFYDQTLLDQVLIENEQVHEFFTLLALCHTVMSEIKKGKLEYQAQSPDEAALSGAARNFGFVFKDRTSNTIEIEVLGKKLTYELLDILDFNNVRKRMSVIVRAPSGRLTLYCKGADSVIFEHLGHGPTPNRIRQLTNDHLEHFAGVGLRTLCLAKKELTEDQYHDWKVQFAQAETALENREEKKDYCYELIEQDLELLGATAIEDKLQDNVPQTIANLIAANIKVWVLTGDKLETAINIGYSCELLNDDMCDIFVIDGCYPEEVERQLKKCQKQINRMLRMGARPSSSFGSRATPPSPAANRKIAQAHEQRTNSKLTNKQRTARKSQQRPKKGRRSNRVTPTSTNPDENNNNNTDIYTINLPQQNPNFLSKNLDLNNNINFNADKNNKNNNNNEYNNEAQEEYTGGRPTPSGIPHLSGGDPAGGFALVISGHSLAHALCPNREQLFLSVACQCKSVICCRVTPLQKALVVDLVKRSRKVITLSIGDGANDVPMIKMAHIGVGISGQEGMQAVLASDFSVAQFCYLERLLLVHGRWSYFRMCKFLRYFFYKNFSFTLCNLWYAFFCGFSAQVSNI